jgi:gas vesicle protein
LQSYSQTSNGPSTAGGASATDQAKDKAQQAAGQAQEKAQQAAGQAKGALRTQVDQRSTQAGEQVTSLASDVRSVGDQLREQGKEQPAKLADQAAQRAEQVGNYLSQSDADRILGDIEDFGRRQPWAVIAGGMALGLLASRFLKASSSRRYEQRWESSRELPARTSYTSPATSGIHTRGVTTGPAVPTTPPSDVDVTVPAGAPGSTAPGSSTYGGTR